MTKLIKKIYSNWILIVILFFAFFIRIYNINNIPGEIWGDVISHIQLANQIKSGDFFIDFRFGGDGPLFSYLAALFTLYTKTSFLSLKLLTAFLGTFLVFGIYIITKELFNNKTLAYISALIASFSFWTISFSRQAKPHIIVPIFVCFVIYFIMKKKYIVAGIILGLGMYTQASFWTTIFFALRNRIVFIISMLLSIPLMIEFVYNQTTYVSQSNFYGEKLGISLQLSFFDYLRRLFSNSLENIASFNFIGDRAFRHTISGQPHLDIVSGGVFVIGFLAILKKGFFPFNKKIILYFIIPFFLIQIPSILDVNNPLSTPNMGRMIGIIPFIYIAIAYAILILVKVARQRFGFSASFFILFFTLGLIAFINLHNYFYVYPQGLPNGNIPFSKIVAQELDKKSSNTSIVLLGCCWGEWAQPEPESISLSLKKEKLIQSDYSLTQADITCKLLKDLSISKPAIAVVAPVMQIRKSLKTCIKEKSIQLLEKDNIPIALLITL